MTKKCECSGALCSCGAEGIVKDGAGVRVQLSAMDAAPNEPNFVSDAGEAWDKTVFDRAGVPVKGDNDNKGKVKQLGDASDPWAQALAVHNEGHEA